MKCQECGGVGGHKPDCGSGFAVKSFLAAGVKYPPPATVRGQCATCRWWDRGERLCSNERGIGGAGVVVEAFDFCSRWEATR